MQWRRRRIPAHERTPVQRVGAFVGGMWDLGAWTYLLIALIVAISRPIGGRPPQVLQALQSGLPVVMAGLPIVAFVSLVTRRWLQLGAAVVLGVSAWLAIAPALGRDTPPFWASKGGRFRVAEANLFVNNSRPLDAANVLFDTNADVIVLAELTEPFVAAATQTGFDERYPYRILDPLVSIGSTSGIGGLGIYSKFPFDDVARLGPERAPVVQIRVPDGQLIRVGAVHTEAPTTSKRGALWAAELARLGRVLESDTKPILFVGDFNASRWQPAFGALLSRGLVDAHEATGHGLSRSWPAGLRLLRLDHALMSEGIVATSLSDLTIPGSDHRGFVVDLVARRVAGAADRPAGPTVDTNVDTNTADPS